jgi:dTDP-4-dehydrorhamnose reductase
MRVLVLGASGMLGNAVARFLDQSPGFEVFGTLRGPAPQALLATRLRERLISGVDVENTDALLQTFRVTRPELVVNCIGLVKQLASVEDPLQAIPINALLPHRLAHLSALVGARLVHLSTDCVFSGAKGMYTEADRPDAYDLYGRSKLLGEVDYEHAITLRTSIIGHELSGGRSLIGWFLRQEQGVRGYRRAIFSGLPTVEIARVIRDHVLPHPELRGLYHLSASPINKYDLLRMVAHEYEKKIDIQPDESVVIDRSLDSTRFRQATGFEPRPWGDLIKIMRQFG